MPKFQTIYPVGLAAANVGVGWLLYGPLNSSVNVILGFFGLNIILVMIHETFQSASHEWGVFPHRISSKSTSEPTA